MTDLEISMLCAEATGTNVKRQEAGLVIYVEDSEGRHYLIAAYNPLHNDAQIMPLIRHLMVNGVLTLSAFGFEFVDRISPIKVVCPWRHGEDEIRRVICECVAKMQLAKQKKAA